MAQRTLGTAVGSVFNAVGSIADTTANAVVGLGSFVDALSEKADAYAHEAKVNARYAKARATETAEKNSARILMNFYRELEDELQDEDNQRLFAQALEAQRKFFEKKGDQE